jgi:hypothetical protein
MVSLEGSTMKCQKCCLPIHPGLVRATKIELCARCEDPSFLRNTRKIERTSPQASQSGRPMPRSFIMGGDRADNALF